MCGHNPNVLTIVSSKAAFFLLLSQLQGHRDLKVHNRETVCSRGCSSRCWWIAYGSRPISPGPINSGKDRSLPAFGCWQHASVTWPLTGHCSSPWGEQIHNAGMRSHWRAHVVLISIPALSGWDCSPTHSFAVCQHPCTKPIGWLPQLACVGGVYSRSDVVSPQATYWQRHLLTCWIVSPPGHLFGFPLWFSGQLFLLCPVRMIWVCYLPHLYICLLAWEGAHWALALKATVCPALNTKCIQNVQNVPIDFVASYCSEHCLHKRF